MMNFRSMGSDGKESLPSAGPPTGGGSLPPTSPTAGLARQSSIYSLTFDELQSTLGGLGKDFGSMNMDELLKNIWTAEETQAMASATAAVQGGDGVLGLQRQGSLTLPRTISQKTVDEVWRDLFKEDEGIGGGGGGQGPSVSALPPQRRQPTLGEMTLEEFLVRAGVVREEPIVPPSRFTIGTGNRGAHSSSTSNNSNALFGVVTASQLSSSPGLALGFPPTAQSSGAMPPNPILNNVSAAGLVMNATSVRPRVQLGDTPELESLGGTRTGGIMGIGDPVVNSRLMPGMVGLVTGGVTLATGSPANHFPSDGIGRGNGDVSSLSPVPYVFNGGLRGRKCSGAVEKVVERRQRRMIKNRESAARSRARKQAYTMELEDEVAKLKEQNQELQKKQVEILELQKNKVLEMINNNQCGPKKRCLRRTQTGPW